MPAPMITAAAATAFRANAPSSAYVTPPVRYNAGGAAPTIFGMDRKLVLIGGAAIGGIVLLMLLKKRKKG